MVASVAAKALVSVTLALERAAAGTSLRRRADLVAVAGALARAGRAVTVVAAKLAETSVVAALAISDGALDTDRAARRRSRGRRGVAVGRGRRVTGGRRRGGGGVAGRSAATAGVGSDGRVSSQRRLGLAGADVEADGERGQTVADERIVEAVGDSADVSVEVVETARADVGNVHEGGLLHDSRATAGKSKLLLADAGRHGEDVSAGGGVLGLGLAARGDGDGTGRLEEGGDVDDVGHGLPAVGTALKVVTGAVVGGAAGGGVGGIAVEAGEGAAVPVDNLLVVNVVVDRLGTGLVSLDEGLGEIQPAVVGPSS